MKKTQKIIILLIACTVMSIQCLESHAISYVTVATSGDNDYVYVYDGQGNELWSYDTGADVISIALSSNGQYAAVGSQGKLYLFNRSGTELWQKNATISQGWGGGWAGKESKTVAISAHGEYVVAGCTNSLYVYTNDGALLWSHPGKQTCVSISPNGNYIAACNNSTGAASLFSIASSTPLWTKSIDAYWIATSNSGYTSVSNRSNVHLYDKNGTQVFSHSHSKWDYDYIRVDMPTDGLSFVAVNDDPGDSQGCVLCYYSHLEDGTPGWSSSDASPVWSHVPSPDTHRDYYTVAISGNGQTISGGGGGVTDGVQVLSSQGTVLQEFPAGRAQSVELTFDGQLGAFGDVAGSWPFVYFSKDSNTPLWTKTITGDQRAVAIGLCDECYMLEITATNGGTKPTLGTYAYEANSVVEVNAIPDECYEFDHWQLDGYNVGSANPYSVVMDSNHTLEAVFVQIEYDLTIIVTSDGTTDPAPGTHSYGCGSYVDVNAIPDECYEFDHWQLDGYDVGSANPYSVVMDSNHTLYPFFICKASDPSPPDRTIYVATDVVLSWLPACCADSHDVYFGTDFYKVKDVNASDLTGIYQGRQDVNSYDTNDYDPNGLELDKIYYWRIDEVNEPNVWKGAVWRFVVNHIVVDDFEDYNDVNKPLWDTWLDGSWNNTGSWLDLGIDPCNPVHGGRQSMIYHYDNSFNWGAGYYSEIEAAATDLSVSSDWYDLGAKALALHFYGDPNNDANNTEQMYVGLQDSLGNYSEVKYGDYGEDINDIKNAEWQEWKINLKDFNDAGVDVNDVNNLYIGFGDRDNQTILGGVGLVYFDDIKLYEKYGPAGDINIDNVVDFEDLEIMCDEWLVQSDQLDADLYKDEHNRINFKDFAVLANNWLESQP